jgi:hypothetical protein
MIFTLLRTNLCMINTFSDDKTQHKQVESQQSLWFTTKEWFSAKSLYSLLNIFLQPKFFLGTRFPVSTTISTSDTGYMLTLPLCWGQSPHLVPPPSPLRGPGYPVWKLSGSVHPALTSRTRLIYYDFKAITVIYFFVAPQFLFYFFVILLFFGGSGSQIYI